MAYAVQEYGQYVQMQLLREVECSSMESLNMAVRGSGTFRKDNDGVSSPYQIRQSVDVLLQTVGDGVELGISYDQSVDGVAMYPVVCQYDEFGAKHQNTHQIEVRLMVADDDGRLLECLSRWVFEDESCARDATDYKARRPAYEAMQLHAFLLGDSSNMKIDVCRRKYYEKHAYAQKQDSV